MTLLLVGCATWRTVPEAVLGGRDGDRIDAESGYQVAVIEGLAHLDEGSLARIRDAAPDRIAISETVPRSTPRHWRRAAAVLATLPPAWPTVGRGDRRGDADLDGFTATWPDVGIPVLSHPVSWYAVDIVTDDVRWRWVVADSHERALGTGWLDQRSWIPKVVSDDRVDRLIISLDGGPDDSATELLELVRDHATADELILVIAHGTGEPGFVAVGGRWGEGRLTPAPLPAGGWWLVDLRVDGLTLRATRPLGATVVHEWSELTGWLRVSEEP